MKLEVHGGPPRRVPDARALQRRQEELNNIRIEETFRDENGNWCCALSVLCSGEIKSVVFVWDLPKGRVERIDEEGPMPPGLFVTARNLAKDQLRSVIFAK